MDHPVAVALSGGGDSMALLRLAADWSRTNGRRLLALTVDHGLSDESAAWTTFAERAVREAGADWGGLCWTGPKPAAGLPAAARRARHRLIADAARAAGARVVLLAHTADDIAEAEFMRAAGSTLGRLRAWSPSPAWPDGRGLMLLRPMLGAGRAEVRDWLAGQGGEWIDDPANEDPRYARSRARASLLSKSGGRHRESVGSVSGENSPEQPPHLRSREDSGGSGVPSTPFTMREGSLELDRDADARTLAVSLVCVGGGDRPPRADRLETLRLRLQSGEDFTANLCGTRVVATGATVLLTREVGEFARRSLPPLPLASGVETVWDGRWALTVDTSGWSVVPAAGRIATLSEPDRARLKGVTPAARGSMPVLIRNDATAPVLAGTACRAVSLVEERLALALDRMTHERDLGAAIHGASLRDHLFSAADITDDRALRHLQGTRRE